MSLSRARVDMDKVWVSFFNMCFEMSEHALLKGWITSDEIKDHEPYLYWGLTGATVLETVFRSENIRGLQLATGYILTPETCPIEHVELFQALVSLRAMVKKLQLDGVLRDELRQMVIYGNADVPERKQSNVLTDSQTVEFKRVAAKIQSVSIRISQLWFFKDQFQNIFELLLICHSFE